MSFYEIEPDGKTATIDVALLDSIREQALATYEGALETLGPDDQTTKDAEDVFRRIDALYDRLGL